MSTIRDVAKESGVCAATVSNVLNNAELVHPDTRARVHSAMQRLQYHPSAVARGLSRKCMDTVGVVLTEGFTSPLISPYFAAVIDGIFQAASDAHQSVLFPPSQTGKDIKHSVTAHQEGRCDGLILFAQLPENRVMDRILAANTPFVLIGDSSEDTRVSSLDVDNTLATAQMVTFLLQQGHRRIAFLSAEVAHSSAARRDGYCRALDTWGIEITPELIRSGTFTAESVTEQVRALVQLPAERQPTALCCYNDDIALMTLTALRGLGLSVPDDMSVTGFDDIPSAAHLGLTTMRQPLGEIGRQALTRLLRQIRREDTTGGTQLLPVEMIVRESVASV